MLVRWLGGAVLALLAIGVFAAQPEFKRYRVPSESMEPTIQHGDIVNVKGDVDPEVGAVVVFHPPSSAADSTCPMPAGRGKPCAETTGSPSPVTFVKRIVAGPGDRIAFRDGGHAVLNGKRLDEPYINACEQSEGCDYPRDVTVPEGTYYLVGDNRGASDDSRFWGPVRAEWILGRADHCSVGYFFCSGI
jgi:signal peptidase I